MLFKGFDPKALDFLQRIAKNNSKEWFEAHKEEYEQLILSPSRLFVEEMGEHLLALEPTLNYAPKINKSLFRIYRDTRRMGADKRPIKERIGFIWWQGAGKRLQSSSFYMHFGAQELYVAAGIRWFEKPMLDAYREFIADDKRRSQLREVLSSVTQKGYEALPYGYKRFPRGFSADMPDVELSLYKGMATFTKLPVALLSDADKLIDTLYDVYEDMLPLQQIVYEITLRRKNE